MDVSTTTSPGFTRYIGFTGPLHIKPRATGTNTVTTAGCTAGISGGINVSTVTTDKIIIPGASTDRQYYLDIVYTAVASGTGGANNKFILLMDSGLSTGDAYPMYSPTLSTATATITNERTGDLEAIRVKIPTSVADATNIEVHFPVSTVADTSTNGASTHTAIGKFAIFYTINLDERYRYVHYAVDSITWGATIANTGDATIEWNTPSLSTDYNNGQSSLSATISLQADTGKDLDASDKVLVVLPTGT